MTGPHDLLLDRPLGATAFQLLLFFTFALHLLLVLLAVGTAVIAAAGRIAGDDRRTGEGLSGPLLHAFFAHKSLAIVLGVAPLLLVLSGRSVPFLSGARLLAPLWMLVVPLLIGALALMEVADARARRGAGAAVPAVAGAALMVAVPACFSALVVAAENPAAWPDILGRGGRLPPALALHWLARFLHVTVAAVVVAAVWHLLRAAGTRRAVLLRWAVGGIAVQLGLGVALLATLPHPPDGVVWTVLTISVGAVGWLWYRLRTPGRPAASLATVAAAVAVVTGMLLARQLQQDRSLARFEQRLEAGRHERIRLLEGPVASRPAAVAVGDPAAIYLRSCSFCHGAVGNGVSREAARLRVPPEDLTGLRMADPALREVLLEGVPGTAMPRFGFYTAGEIDGLIGFLRDRIGLAASPRREIRPAVGRDGESLFLGRCTPCHSPDGSPTALASGFTVAPPDLARLTLAPSRINRILNAGYPGTMMRAFPSLDAADRRALAVVLHQLYRGGPPVVENERPG